MENRPHFIVVHHSATRDDDHLDMPAIRWFHTKRRRWRDIGYHRIYERVSGHYVAVAGRPLHMAGSHARGFNNRSIGVCFIGNFSSGTIDHRLLKVGARDIAGLAQLLDIPPYAIYRHRDISETECPGTNFPWKMLEETISWYRVHPAGTPPLERWA